MSTQAPKGEGLCRPYIQRQASHLDMVMQAINGSSPNKLNALGSIPERGLWIKYDLGNTSVDAVRELRIISLST